MECITNLDALKEWVELTLKRGAVTNCYLGSADYKRYIDEKSLYLLSVGGVRFLFHDLGVCDRIYYCFDDKALLADCGPACGSLFCRVPGRAAFTEVLYRQAGGLPSDVLSYFGRLGLDYHIDRRRMTAVNRDFKAALEDSGIEVPFSADYCHSALCGGIALKAENGDDVVIRFAARDEGGLILEMISHAFDPYTSYIPGLAELVDIIGQNRVLGAFDADGQLLGAFHFEVKGSVAFVNHIVVSGKARRLGIAGLLLAWGRALCDRKDKLLWRLWVRQDNVAAQSAYLKYAFKFDGTCCMSILNGPPKTGPNQTGPNQTGPPKTDPNQTGPPKTDPDQTGPAALDEATLPEK